MADTVTATGLRVQQWDDDFFTEYVRENRFRPYFGTNENSVIQIREDLTKKRGDRLTFNLVNRLTQAAVTGSNMLEGNEESMGQRSHLLTVDKLRNAVRVAEMEEVKNAIDLRDAARSTLKTWISEHLRDSIITAYGSIPVSSGVYRAYSAASEAEKDAFLVDNVDRVLFGAVVSNGASLDHSTALANVDNTTDKLTPDAISLMKRLAQKASPKIRPVMVKGDEEWYVLYANALAMRDLKTNTAFTQSNRDARDRGKDNPLFKGADFVWDGVIIREIPEIAVVTGVGAAGIDVAPVYLSGAQALGIGWAKRTTTKTKEFDYGDKYGVAIEEIRGVEKLFFGSGNADTDDLKQNGVVTGWFAAVAD